MADHHNIGSVRIDLQATHARYEAAASIGPKYDTRSILYTSDLRSHHRYVRVTLQNTPTTMAYAELRASPQGTSWMSMGLLVALGLNTSQVGVARIIEVDVLAVQPQEDKPSTCKCSRGVVSYARVHFASRPRPPRAVVEALNRAISTLLRQETIWEKRQMLYTGLNGADLIEFQDVSMAQMSSGCCSPLATCSSDSRIELSFLDDAQAHGDREFDSVDEYVSRIERTLGGVAHHATRVITALRNRLSGSGGCSAGAILSGLPGIGKTALAKAICDSLGVHVRFLNAADVFQTYVGHSEAHIVKSFEDLVQNEPSILVIDGLESVATSREGFLDSESTLEVGVLGTFLSCLDKLKLSNASVFVLGTTSRLDDIDLAVYSNGRMDLVVQMEPPTQKERLDILNKMICDWSVGSSHEELATRLSESTGGFVGADLLSMCQKALQNCINDQSVVDMQSPEIQSRHFDDALAATYPSVLQAHHVSLRHQDTSFSSKSEPFSGIYGVDKALRTIRVSLLEPLKNCSRFSQFGTVPPKGILLTGPPGSGKTHLANVVGAELRRRGLASFVSVRCTDLLTKVVGDTEKALRDLFETARSAAPCVIYFDQIESIAPVRGFDTSTEQTFDRLLSMLLVEMDGFSTSRFAMQHSLSSAEARNEFLKNHIVILASTTQKHQLDPAILRPGRFDVHIELDLPNHEARVQIVRDAMVQIPIDFSSDNTGLGSAAQLATFIADHSPGFTAGDLTSLLREAAMASMREKFDTPTIAIRYVREALQQRQTLRESSSQR